MKKFLFITLIILASGFLMAAGTSRASRSTYPSGHDLSDPTNKWVISWIVAPENETHQLFLKNLKTNKSRLLYAFDRSVQVDWAPDGCSLSLTDLAGSSDSLLYIAFPDKKELINIEKIFIKQFGKTPDIYSNGHRYFEATRWLNSKQLEFTIKAYDSMPDNGEYFATYIYSLNEGIKKQ